MAILVKF